MKRFLKKIKYKVEAIFYILQRTIFSPFLKVKVPLNSKIIVDTHVKFHKGTRIIFYGGSANIGQDSIICNDSKFIIGLEGKLKIGHKCILGEYGIYNVFSDLIIGNNVITADRVSFVTNNHKYEDINTPIKDQPSTSKEIIIGDGTWIGMNATILAGSRIGKNCVVAAHSVVKGEYPDYCVIGGIPSHILKMYNANTGAWEKVD